MLGNKITSFESAESDSFDLSGDVDDLLASFSSPQKSKSKTSQVKQISGGSKSDKRRNRRHPVHWRVAIVNKSSDKRDIYHGYTKDVSLSCVSILSDHNVSFSSEIVLLLAIPPMHHGEKECIVEIRCNEIYTVLDSEHGQFRVSMKIDHIKGEGKRILSDILSKRHIPKEDPMPLY
jgi:hypothetical protein